MPVADKYFELTYDPKKVRETLRVHAARRGVKVSAASIPAGTRIGNYKRQAEKRIPN